MFRTTLAALAVLALTAGAAAAQDRYFVHVGPGQLAPDEDAVISSPAFGGVIPGANVSLDSSVTAAAEVGYKFAPNLSASVTFGLPPTEDVMATGPIAPFGRLGELKYGPAAVMGQYRFTGMGAIEPYVGGGLAVMYVFEDNDGSATNLEVENAAGPALQVGAEFMFSPRFGVFVDYKKAWFDTEASGNLAGAPFNAEIQVDPSFLHGGIAFRW